MAYSSPHTAARLRCGDRRLDAWTQGQKKNVISSGSGSLRALEASGRRQRLSTTATPPKTPLLAGQPRRRRDAILQFGRGAGDAPGHGVRAGRDSAI